MLAVLLLCSLAGCDGSIGSGKPRLDCSSEKAYEESLKKMAESIPESEKVDLWGAMFLCSTSEAIKNLGDGKTREKHETMKRFHGMTYQQLIGSGDKESQRHRREKKSEIGSSHPQELTL